MGKHKDHPTITFTPQDWEFEPIRATAKFDFSLTHLSHSIDGWAGGRIGPSGGSVTHIALFFKAGEEIEGRWSQREYVEPPRLSIDFEKAGFRFRLNEADFFKLFDDE